jgi:eukaryotic-like serine/threonine-protein kinase
VSHSIPRFQLGSYEPLIELASGGMATVYVARQIGAAGFERLVVLKRVHPHLVKDKEFTNMFRDEARLASLVRHANVVSVVDVVENDSELFLVMDYVESTSVATLMRRVRNAKDRLHPAVASRIVCDVLAGLHAAHEAVDMRGLRLDVVHRDVSPQNIIVGIDGTSRLIDFGIAKAQNRLTETRTGSIKGKLGYMSPEGAHGQQVDRTADIFSTGVVLFETMTATRLFHGENDLDTLRRISEAAVPSACGIIPMLPPPLDHVLSRALARDPAHRFPTALDFMAALNRIVPPAPAHEVAATMQHFCGQHLEQRRSDLLLRLEGKVDTVRLISHDPESIQSGVLRAAEQPGTGQRIATSADIQRVGASRVWPTAAVLVVAAGAILGGVTFALGHGSKADAVASASASGAASAAPATPEAPAPAATPAAAATAAPIELAISSDAKIDHVEAKGVRHADVDGKKARVELEPWTGDLNVDVVLANKAGTVHVVAAADGPRELAVKARDKARETSAHAQAPRAPTAPPAAPAARPKTGDELHDNPYGGP